MTSQENDLDLVSKIRNGDRSAFESLFKTHYQSLCFYALRFVGETQLAENTVQDVFLKCWEDKDSLNFHSSVKAYLYKSVHNRCLNLLKRQQIEQRYIAETDPAVAISDDGIDEQENLQLKIREAIDQLPPQCKRIFELSRMEGLKYREIADHLDISVKTVENQMGKALRMLRESLKSYIQILGICILLFSELLGGF